MQGGECVLSPGAELVANGASVCGALSRPMLDGYEIHQRDDEIDYRGIIGYLETGRLQPEKMLKDKPKRKVALVESEGKRFVVKYHVMQRHHLEDSFRRHVLGGIFPRIFKETGKAISRGCDFIQDVFFVAEKQGNKGTHSIMLCEYVEGTPLDQLGVATMSKLKPRIKDLVLELHKYGIAFGDPNPGNIIVTATDELKLIDISCRNSFLVGKAKDIVMMQEFYGIEIEPEGTLDSLVVALVKLNRGARNQISRLKKILRVVKQAV